MDPFLNECVLAEKNMNMLSNTEKPSMNSHNLTYKKSLPSSTTPPTEKRAPLTKAYSCSDAISSNEHDNFSFLSPTEFLALVSENPNTNERRIYPIVDCRSQIDFGCEHIRLSYNINCRAKIMARKLISKRLEDVEPSLRTSLNNSDFVILYDQSTDRRNEDRIHSSPLNLVIQAAKKSNKTVYILQGGLDAIKAQYPHLIECAIDTIPREKHEHELVPSSPAVFDKENFTMTQILPNVFVGNVHDAQNLERLSQHGITHILNSTPDLPCFYEHKCQYMRACVLDLPSENIRKYFDKAFQFIDDALRLVTNNVLVHCSAGISRSPTLVLAYMIKKYHMSLDEAFNQMRQLRQIVDPNISFMLQLRDWEKMNLLTTTTILETNEDNPTITCTPIRSTPSSIYCGSTSKSKTDKNSLKESAIIVN